MAKTRSMKKLPESSRRSSPRTKTINKNKKKFVQQKSSSGDNFSKNGEIIDFDHDPVPAAVDGGCSTPKGQRFKIPEIDTCPPAPMKQRVINPNCLVQRRKPIAFYAHPDIELFFLFSTT